MKTRHYLTTLTQAQIPKLIPEFIEAQKIEIGLKPDAAVAPDATQWLQGVWVHGKRRARRARQAIG